MHPRAGPDVGHPAGPHPCEHQVDQTFGLRARDERATVAPEHQVPEAGPTR